MTQLTNFNNIPLQSFYDELQRNKSNPSAMFGVAGKLLEDITGGEVAFVDPTNPAVFLAEFAATMTAMAINENVVNLRKAYSSLAEVPGDLYYDMTDVDYANRFSSPTIIPITLMLSLSPLLRDMVRDDSESCVKAIIPRDSYFVAGPYTYTLQYPLVIRYFDSGSLEVSYDADIVSPFQELETNIIPYSVVTTTDGTQMLRFEVPVYQLELASHNATIQKSAPFTMSVTFDDQFFYARAYHKSSSTSGWTEILTTHSNFVFDRRTPTLLLSVDGNQLSAKLPIVYTTEGMTGEIMLVVYTSKGQVTDNMANYDFNVNIRAIDSDRDLTPYTTVSLRSTSIVAASGAMMTGGRNALTFEELRERVIFNAQGPQQLPITTAQAQAMLENNGFEVAREVDVVTNRIFLATQKLPKPRDPRLLTTANIGIDTFITERVMLEGHPFVRINDTRWTLLPKNLYKRDNGVISLMSWQAIQDIAALEITARVQHLNSNQYLYSPFHYVYDNEDNKFAMRAYYLDKPTAGLINFVRQNETLQLPVNTAQRSFVRTENGFRLIITVLSGQNYKNLPDSQVGAQLMMYPSGDTIPVYLKGELMGVTDGNERVFAFDFNTNYDLVHRNQKHLLRVLQADLAGSTAQDVWIDLETEVHLFHCTNSITTGYQSDDSVAMFGKFQFSEQHAPITHEKLDLSFGQALDNLWTRARSLTTGFSYRRHLYDIPLLYDRDVYETDETGTAKFTIENNEPVFNKLHSQGDPVLDDQGQPVYKYLAGSPVINPSTGEPEFDDHLAEKKEVDLLFVDGRHYFVNDSVYLAYNQEMVDTLVTWITEDLEAVKNRLLDQTKIFFHPRSQLGYAEVETNDGFIDRIPSEQSPVIDLYVKSDILRNEEIREIIQRTTIQVLDDHLNGREINVALVTEQLRDAYADTVISFSLAGFGGERNLSYALLTKETQRVTIRRILEIQADNSLIMTEDVTINFHRVENKK